MKTTILAMVFENLEPEFLVLIIKRKCLFFDCGKKKERKDFRFVRFEETTETRGF
jgi:hypothetical protein